MSCIPPEKLREDVDYAYNKLKEMHPNLYWYISEQDLKYKFDSLKNTLNTPLSPLQFYFRLQPLIASVREGHLSLKVPARRFTKKEVKALEHTKGLFSRFGYYVEGDRLFIVSNADSIQNIQPGTEILSINHVPVSDYMKKYRKLISSDGFNTTFYPYYLKDVFFNFYTAEHGFDNQAVLETVYQGQHKTYTLKRESKSESELASEKKQAKLTPEKKVHDYDAFTQSYNRSFSFLDQDSTVAYIKVKSFSESHSEQFYKDAFARIKAAGASYLILDIRNNYGGSLYEINHLYSYLTSEPYTLIHPSQLASAKTPLKTNYFRQSSPWQYIIKGITYPVYLTTQAFSTYSRDGKTYYRMKESRPNKPQPNAFTGKLFVLINGSSFSASSILASKLKNDHRATLIGEETGGANDGTVAGFYSYQQLPNSKLSLPVGLLLVQPDISFSGTRKGVVPDVTIRENMQEVIDHQDPEMNWVMSTIMMEKGTLVRPNAGIKR